MDGWMDELRTLYGDSQRVRRRLLSCDCTLCCFLGLPLLSCPHPTHHSYAMHLTSHFSHKHVATDFTSNARSFSVHPSVYAAPDCMQRVLTMYTFHPSLLVAGDQQVGIAQDSSHCGTCLSSLPNMSAHTDALRFFLGGKGGREGGRREEGGGDGMLRLRLTAPTALV